MNDGMRAADAVDDVPQQVIGSVTLTQREKEILYWMSEGKTDREIANRLSISERTASNHVNHILAKLGARNRAHAVALGLRLRLVPFIRSMDGDAGTEQESGGVFCPNE